MILITGATENLGNSVVRHLLKRIQHSYISIFARTELKTKFWQRKGVQVRLADLTQPHNIYEALKGVEKLLLISTTDPQCLQQQKKMIDAAVNAGVKHLIYTGLAIQDIERSAIKQTIKSHFQTEVYIQKSGLNYTFMRNSMYVESIPALLGEHVFEQGMLLSGGHGKVPYVACDEIGEAIAHVLVETGHENKTYHLTGSRSYSYEDIAKTLSLLANKKVCYINADEAVYRQKLCDLNCPENIMKLTLGTVKDVKYQQYEIDSQDLEHLLGRPTLNLSQHLKNLYAF